MRIRLVVGALCALGAAFALTVNGISVSAQQPSPPCDFVTGGGYIYPTGPATGAKGTFGAGGGCKNGSGLGVPPAPYWGHLEYHDQADGLIVHGTKITAYLVDTAVFPDPKGRLICGTATTNRGDVNFVVRTKDAGEPGFNDEFDIQLQGSVVYSTFVGGPHNLGGGTGGGGNILLQKPNNSNTGIFGGMCPALITSQQQFTLTVNKTGTGAGDGTVTSFPTGIACGSTCSASFNADETVTLTATSPLGTAIRWVSGCDTSVNNPDGVTATCTVMMTADKQVVVSFGFSE